MADAEIPYPSTLRKREIQTLGVGGMVGNFKFICTIDIYDMAGGHFSIFS